MKYDAIIIGAGAAGLFCAANAKIHNGLILDQASAPGRKLLMSGAGQCNLTHGGSIKDFISHYGENGKRIRLPLYKASNLKMMDFFESHGIPLIERDDGKVFPESMRASDILNLLMHLSAQNGWKVTSNTAVTSIRIAENNSFIVNERFEASKLIIACGGCSIPITGSDGSIFPLLRSLGLKVIEPVPALVPLTVQHYPYGELSGISFKNVIVHIDSHCLTDDLLLTHSAFSGPAILNLSRYAKPGSNLIINYLGKDQKLEIPSSDKRQILHWLSDSLWLPKRFVESVLHRAAIDCKIKANQLSKKQKQAIANILMRDTFSISGTTGFKNAMVTAGGVSLDEIDLKTFACKQIPGLHIIGETLDIDGDTGGYNLQFAFSSGILAAQSL